MNTGPTNTDDGADAWRGDGHGELRCPVCGRLLSVEFHSVVSPLVAEYRCSEHGLIHLAFPGST
ncbi:MAG TPA: hypothetical protein VGP24_13020 [Glaciihabitans sp.]|nr:hypothetical protein [Glaciihabitans sp.]